MGSIRGNGHGASPEQEATRKQRLKARRLAREGKEGLSDASWKSRNQKCGQDRPP